MATGIDADGIILGGGCAGLALGMQLARRGSRRRVIIVDPRTAYGDDRSWCFWASPDHEFAHRVTRQWPDWLFSTAGGPPIHHRCESAPYQYLRARDFYAEAHAWLAAAPNIELRLGTRAQGVCAADNVVTVETGADTLSARWVVDTRPPATTASALLYQCFEGHEVRLPAANQPAPEHVELMTDMRADDASFVFSYVLPLARDRVLVESTRFAPEPPPPARLTADTETVLAARGWQDAPRERRETGILPMGLTATGAAQTSAVVRAGTAGGGLRAASGFGFLRIQAWAHRCAECLEQTGWPLGHPREPLLRGLMDRVFLRAVRSNPDLAPRFFLDIAGALEPAAFVRFMTDGARPRDYLKMIASLPPGPFLRALVQPSDPRP